MISPSELRALAPFKDVSANAAARLATAMREQTYTAGQMVLREGDSEGGLFLVVSGRVTICKRIDSSRSKIIARMSAGGFFGEMSLLDKLPASADVVAEEPTRLFLLTRADFEFLMSKAPAEALHHMTTLLASVCRNLRQTTRELVTVYQLARDVSEFGGFDELAAAALHTLGTMLDATATAGLYRWDAASAGFMRTVTSGPHQELLPESISGGACGPAGTIASFPNTNEGHPLSDVVFPVGHLVMSRSDLGMVPQALFLYFTPSVGGFNSGDRQAMETVSLVLAPAFETAKTRETIHRKRAS